MSLTRREIFDIVGRGVLDDKQIADIIATGATASDLARAYNRVVRGGFVEASAVRSNTATVGRLCEILSTIDPNEDA